MSKLRLEYGSEKKFLTVTLNYLRICIIISLRLDESNEDMIKAIDDSFLDKSVEDSLKHKVGIIAEIHKFDM